MKKLLFYACSSVCVMLLATACSDSGQDGEPEPSGGVTQTAPLPEPELGGYGRGFVLRDMRFLWTLKEDSLDVKLVAKTTGWVAIGFNPDEPENIFAGHRHHRRLHGRQIDSLVVPAPFEGLLLPGSFDEDPPHGLGGSGKEMASVVPALAFVVIDEADICFVDECGGLERLAGRFVSQLL